MRFGKIHDYWVAVLTQRPISVICAARQLSLAWTGRYPNSIEVLICDAKGEENGVRQYRQALPERSC